MFDLVQHDRSDPQERGWFLPTCFPFPVGGFEDFPGTATGPNSIYIPGLSRGLVILPGAVSPRIACHLLAHLTFDGQTPDGEELNAFHSTFSDNWLIHEVYCSAGFLIDLLTGKQHEALAISDDELRELALDPDRYLDQKWTDLRTAVINGKRAFTAIPIPGWSPQIAYRVVIDLDLFSDHDGGLIQHNPTGNPDLPASRNLLRSPRTLLAVEAAHHVPKKGLAAGAALAAAAIKFKASDSN